MKFLYLLMLSAFLSACFTSKNPVANLDYLGSSYAPTDSVQVFVDVSAIEKPYTIIGKAYMKTGVFGNIPVHKIQVEAVEKGKAIGADAVLIQDYFLPVAGYNTILHTDSIGKGTVTVGNTSVHQTPAQRFTIAFLRYK